MRFDVAHRFIETSPVRTHDFSPTDKITVLVKENPKREGSKAHRTFALYRDGMTVAAFEKAYDAADLLAAFNEMPLDFAGYQKPNNTLMPGLPGHSYWAERVREILARMSLIWAE